MQTTSQPNTTLLEKQLIVALSEQNQLLLRQVNLLKQLVAKANEAKLGLHSRAGIQKIYCNRKHNSLWYSLDRDRQPIPITESAITGYLTGLKFETVTRKNQETSKLLVTIDAERIYLLESGYDSHFSKGLLSAIASLTTEQLRSPITIAPYAGDEESVLFCSIWLGNERCFAPYNENTDGRAIASIALSNAKTLAA